MSTDPIGNDGSLHVYGPCQDNHYFNFIYFSILFINIITVCNFNVKFAKSVQMRIFVRLYHVMTVHELHSVCPLVELN